jgi:hypothetical protein
MTILNSRMFLTKSHVRVKEKYCRTKKRTKKKKKEQSYSIKGAEGFAYDKRSSTITASTVAPFLHCRK